jgi:hypothetical protein
MRILRFATLLVLIGLVSGCAMVQLGYRNLDTWTAYKADEYFDLDPTQKYEFRVRFERLHEWHRSQQLPEYAGFFKEAKSRLQKTPTREDIIWFTEGLKARYRTICRRITSDAAALLATLKPEQFDALQKQWDDDNRRFIRIHRLNAGPEERKRARAERALDELKKWTSTLTAEQERRITALSDAMPSIAALRHQDRIRRQREFRQLLEARTSSDFAPQLERYLLDWEGARTPEYERILTEWWDKRIDYFISVYQILTPQQRIDVANRLQGYIDDFTALSERGGRAASR